MEPEHTPVRPPPSLKQALEAAIETQAPGLRRPTFSGKPMAPPPGLVRALSIDGQRAEREAREAARRAFADAKAAELEQRREQRRLDREERIAAKAAAKAAKAAEPKPVPTLEQEERAKAQLKQRLREAKGKPLAELPERKMVVELKVEGWTHEEVAEHLHISTGTVARHLKQWQISQTPSEETSAQLREIMLQRLERMHRREWRRYELGDDKAGELLLKVMDRTSKLMGSDLQPSGTTIAISAESIARFLGWDPDPGGPSAVKIIDMPPRPQLPPALGTVDHADQDADAEDDE